MHATRKLNSDIIYIGSEDRRLQLFENMFPIERGISYNSYLIADEKTALMDTVDFSVSRHFFENLTYALDGRKLDYLIINHMEPDHCAVIEEIFSRYPEAVIVGNMKTFQMIGQFYTFAIPEERKLVVKEGDCLSLGRHELHFVMAPMVHWPEVMMTYDATDKILFCADAFGSFGTNNGNIFNDEIDYKAKDFVDDFRRYYTNIVGKYGMQVQAVLKKASGLEIQMFCPLHGPIWREDLAFALDLYQKWSKYEAEDNTVVVCYSSVYGNTESAVAALVMKLAERGVKGIKVYDVSKTDVSVMISEIFRVTTLVLAATTYNNGIFPKMHNLLEDMKALAVQKKKVAVIENGTWAPQSGKLIRHALEEMKDMTVIGDNVTLKSAVKKDSDLDELADAIAASLS